MHEDLVELLELLSRAGRIADRMLDRFAEARAPEPEPEPEPALEPEPLPVLVAEEEEPVLPPSEPPSPPPQLAVPADFRIGSQAGFRDSWPAHERWFSAHAADMLIERYGVDQPWVYKTLLHVRRLLETNEALPLYADKQGRVWAVHFFGRVAFLATDLTGTQLVTFLPPDTQHNDEIAKRPKTKVRLQRYIEQVQADYEVHRARKQRAS